MSNWRDCKNIACKQGRVILKDAINPEISFPCPSCQPYNFQQKVMKRRKEEQREYLREALRPIDKVYDQDGIQVVFDIRHQSFRVYKPKQDEPPTEEESIIIRTAIKEYMAELERNGD